MGFLGQVPLSARFLLYRAVRGGLAPLRQGRASATQQNVYSPCGLAGQTTAAKDLPLPPNFRARWRGWNFSSHPRANLYKKGSPGAQKKKCCCRPRQSTAPQQQSTGILFSRNDIPKVSPQQFNRQSVLFANFACFYFKALLSHFVKDKF